MQEFSSCVKCNYETSDPLKQCPKCNGRMLSSRRVRMLGWLLVILGAFLVVMMASVTVLLVANFSHFTGTTAQAATMFFLFAVIIAFGFFSFAAGVWQIKHGKRNKTIFFIGLGLAILLVMTTLATLRVLG